MNPLTAATHVGDNRSVPHQSSDEITSPELSPPSMADSADQTLQEIVPYDDDEMSSEDTLRPMTQIGRRAEPVYGDKAGKYVLEGKLGRGGFGSVYIGRHEATGERAAIKVLRYSADKVAVSRFKTEAMSVNRIKHPNIVRVFEFGVLDDGRMFHVMELLEGKTLRARMREGRMSVAEVWSVVKSIGEALSAAHAANVAHRDLKPENIFMVESAGGTEAKLLDFGLAKLLTDVQLSHRTKTGTLLGTPMYMSPEQCRGKGVDQRTDVYALGVVVYEMLAGRPPFPEGPPMAVMLHQTDTVPEPASTHSPELSPLIDEALSWMLAKDKASRPPTIDDAVAGLERAFGFARPTTSDFEDATHTGLARTRPSRDSLFKPAARSSAGPILAAALFAGVVLGIMAWWFAG
jgi:serine/threonine-protein kinase